MQRIDEFIIKLEANHTTPNERRGFVGSLTKKEFIYFLKQDFSNGVQRSVDIRNDLFEEYIHQTENLISKFTIGELKDVLYKIKPQYVTIKNLFIEHLINLIHAPEEHVDVKKIIEFKNRVEQGLITHEDIRSFLLRMKKEEFSVFITLDKQDVDSSIEFVVSNDNKLDEMYEYQAEIIAEILEEYTEDEMVELVPFLNDASARIRTMFFKCFNEKKANEIFLTNASKYSNDIFSYIVTPTQSSAKDELIISILSDSKLYSLYNVQELQYLRALISNKEAILDEKSCVINITEEEIKQEAAKYIANLRCRDNNDISRGVLKKISAKKLYDLLNEVNKGLLNIGEDAISYKEFIKLIGMPLDKAILFLKNCINLIEEDKKQILNEIYIDNEYSNFSINEAVTKVLAKYMKIVTLNDVDIDSNFDFIYQDLLEMTYNQSFFENMLKSFSRSEFIGISAKSMNVLLAQLIEKINLELDLDVKKEFYVGKSFVFGGSKEELTIGTYSSRDNKIVINTNAYSEVVRNKKDSLRKSKIREFMNRITMIESIFHELRHAYQHKVVKRIGTVRDLYFLMDDLIHRESFLGSIYYKNNYSCDSMEVDAELYSLVATASLLRVDSNLKEMYWNTFSADAKKLAKMRKSPQLRKIWSTQLDNEKESLVKVFNELFGGDKLRELVEDYPMLDIISNDGYILCEEDLIERYMAIEQSLKDDKLDDESYQYGKEILRFLGEYLDKIHNKRMKHKKIV